MVAWLIIPSLVCVLLARPVAPTCVGNSCPEEHEAATSSGLLGGTWLTECTPKDYSQKLDPVTLQLPVLDIRWAGTADEHDKYVLALTQPALDTAGGHVWRSDSYGYKDTWKDVTDQLPGVWDQTPDVPGQLPGVLDILYHPNQPHKMLLQGAAHRHWVTEDYGGSFRVINTPSNTLGYWTQIRIHPSKADWMLAKVRRNECLQHYAALDKWCAYDLFVSQDFGGSWQNLTANSKGKIASFMDFDWGANLHMGEASHFPDETIFATAYENADHMKGLYAGWDKNVHYVQSSDFFQTQHNKLVSCGNQFEIVGRKVYLALPSSCPTNPDGSPRKVPAGAEYSNSVLMYVSTDEGQNFIQACLPVRDLDLGYNLVRTHDGDGAFVIVDHDEQDLVSAMAPISNVYSQGGNSSLFSLSLARNFRRDITTDFARVDGLHGVYLANQLSLSALQDASFHWQSDYEMYVQTKISFTSGSQWQDLQRPTHFQNAACDRCGSTDPNECKLHLHGPSSWHSGPGERPSFYSHHQAPGVVMAVGNTGKYLDFASDAVCTWLSLDGGMNWRDVADHAAIYEFGDHGNLLVMAPHETQGPATSLKFSMDEGRCWNTINFSEALNIQNIRVEPTATSHTFMVHGEACARSAANPTCTHDKEGQISAGKLYVVDVEAIMGTAWAECGPNDYEKWSPPTPELCLMGRNITLERRKPDAACFNGKRYERPEGVNETCPCYRMDFECEFGYELDLSGGCSPMVGIDVNSCPSVAQGNYLMSKTHLRLVESDVCYNTTRVVPDTDAQGNEITPEAGGGGGGLPGWLKALLAILGVSAAVGCFGAWWVFKASEQTKAAAEELLSPVEGFCASCYHWAKDKLTGGHARQDAEGAYFQPLASGDDFGLNEEDARSPPLFPDH